MDLDTRKILPNPYYKAVARRCYGCVELEGKRKEIPKEENSTYVSLVINDG